MKTAAFFAYADNYLIDVKFGIIMDVEASRAIRQAEVGASRTMIERTEATFGIKPQWLAADTAYGSAANLDWLVNQQKVAPYIPVIDKSQRDDGTFSREEFIFDKDRNIYICPANKALTTTGRLYADHKFRYRASVPGCRACPLKLSCCPKAPARRIDRDVNEEAAMLPAHSLKPGPMRNRVTIAKRSRCYSPISSASWVSSDCVCEVRAAHNSNLPSPPSHKTCVGSPSS